MCAIFQQSSETTATGFSGVQPEHAEKRTPSLQRRAYLHSRLRGRIQPCLHDLGRCPTALILSCETPFDKVSLAHPVSLITAERSQKAKVASYNSKVSPSRKSASSEPKGNLCTITSKSHMCRSQTTEHSLIRPKSFQPHANYDQTACTQGVRIAVDNTSTTERRRRKSRQYYS
jgi:hypothetical protein